MPKQQYQTKGSNFIDQVLEDLEAGKLKNINDAFDPQNSSALSVACALGSLEAATIFIETGADVNALVNDTTALIEACKSGNLALVKYLVKNGAKVHSESNAHTPLSQACESDKIKIVEFLITQKADVNSMVNGVSPLMIACQGGYASIVKMLIVNGAEINKTGSRGYSPFMKACQSGDLQTVKLILDSNNKVKINTDANYESPLILVCRSGNLDLVKFLIEEQGADINYHTYYRAPLHEAIFSGRREVAKYLIERGADTKLNPFNGYYYNDYVEPSSMAEHKGLQDIVELIKDATVFSKTIEKGQYYLAKVLVDKGTSMDAKPSHIKKAIQDKQFALVASIIDKDQTGKKSDLLKTATDSINSIVTATKDASYKIKIGASALLKTLLSKTIEAEEFQLAKELVSKHKVPTYNLTDDQKKVIGIDPKADSDDEQSHMMQKNNSQIDVTEELQIPQNGFDENKTLQVNEMVKLGGEDSLVQISHQI